MKISFFIKFFLNEKYFEPAIGPGPLLLIILKLLLLSLLLVNKALKLFSFSKISFMQTLVAKGFSDSLRNFRLPIGERLSEPVLPRPSIKLRISLFIFRLSNSIFEFLFCECDKWLHLDSLVILWFGLSISN